MRTKQTVQLLNPDEHRHLGTFVVVETDNSTYFLIGDGRALRLMLSGNWGLLRGQVLVGELLNFVNQHGAPANSGVPVRHISVYDHALSLEISVPHGMQRDVKHMLAQITAVPRGVIQVSAK